MALRQNTVRLLISDDVGIGKTVEAGLIASELLAQGEAKGLAVLCSPALAEQWQDELRTKFGIDAELVLASTVPRLERALAYGQSLFDRHQTVVVSTDFIKSTRHRDDFVDHCPDLVIVDEAHTCVAADGSRSSTGSASSATSFSPRSPGTTAGTCCSSPPPRTAARRVVPQPARPAQARTGRRDLDSDAGREPARRALRAAPPPRHPPSTPTRQARSPGTGSSRTRPTSSRPATARCSTTRSPTPASGSPPLARSAAGSSGSPGGRRSRCCAPWSPPRAPPPRPCAPAPRPRPPPPPRRPTRSAPAHQRLGRQRRFEGIDVAPGAETAARQAPPAPPPGPATRVWPRSPSAPPPWRAPSRT